MSFCKASGGEEPSPSSGCDNKPKDTLCLAAYHNSLASHLNEEASLSYTWRNGFILGTTKEMHTQLMEWCNRCTVVLSP